MHTSKFLHNTVHYYFPAVLAFFVFASAICDVYNFDANVFDYGLFTNITWNFSQGDGWLASFYADSFRENFLGDHWALLIAGIAPIFYIFPSPYTYAILTGLALSSVLFLIPLFVKKIWAEAGLQNYHLPALFLLLALFFSKGFLAPLAFQVHMTTLITPCILLALYFLHSQKLWLTCLCCCIIALSQERGIVAVASVGVYAFLVTKHRSLGFALCLCSSIYFILALKVFIPAFSLNKGYMYDTLLSPGLFLKEKVAYIFIFIASWFLLPLGGKKAAFAFCAALPLIAVNLMSNRGAMFQFTHQYQDMPNIFFFAASVHGLLFIMQTQYFQKVPQKILTVLACISIVALANFAHKYIPIHAITKAIHNTSVHQLHKEILPYKNLSPDLILYTTTGIGSHFALRKNTRMLLLDESNKIFTNSIILLAPHVSIYPNNSAEELAKKLYANKSLVCITASQELLVFASKDINSSTIQKDTGLSW